MLPGAEGITEGIALDDPLRGQRRVLDAAGALIAIDLSGVDGDLISGFDTAWADAIAPAALVPDTTVIAKDHLGEGYDSLDRAIRAEARAVLRTRDAWALEATLLLKRRSAVLVLSEADDLLRVGPSAAHELTSLGSSLVSVDPHGAIECYRSPVRMDDGAVDAVSFVPPSRLDGVVPVPLGVRLGALVVAERSDRYETVHLNLEDSLSALAQRSTVFGGSRMPLRSLSRIVAGVGGVVLVRYTEPTEIGRVIADMEVRATPMPHALRAPSRAADGDGSRVGERLFRSGPWDSVETPEGQLVLLRRTESSSELAVLRAEEADVWRGASGSTPAEVLAHARRQSPHSSESALRRALQDLERRGLVSHEPWWLIADDVAWSEQGDSTVVLGLRDPETMPLALGGSAHAVWHIIASNLAVSQGQVIAELTSLYGVEPETIASDVDDLLDTLRQARLVELL
ncbi:PqqD family protein [Microbacterium saperdae]